MHDRGWGHGLGVRRGGASTEPTLRPAAERGQMQTGVGIGWATRCTLEELQRVPASRGPRPLGKVLGKRTPEQSQPLHERPTRPLLLSRPACAPFLLQVATRRTRTAGKADIPSVDDPVSKLEHMGKETVKKLGDLATAAEQAGVEIDIPENCVQKGAQAAGLGGGVRIAVRVENGVF